jgi:hypothetical protein
LGDAGFKESGECVLEEEKSGEGMDLRLWIRRYGGLRDYSGHIGRLAVAGVNWKDSTGARTASFPLERAVLAMVSNVGIGKLLSLPEHVVVDPLLSCRLCSGTWCWQWVFDVAGTADKGVVVARRS